MLETGRCPSCGKHGYYDVAHCDDASIDGEPPYRLWCQLCKKSWGLAMHQLVDMSIGEVFPCWKGRYLYWETYDTILRTQTETQGDYLNRLELNLATWRARGPERRL